MTTLADARRLAAPLLARHPDLAMVKRLILIKPVTHVLRALEIGGSADPTMFNICWFAQFTFPARPLTHYTWGTRFSGVWERGDPALAASLVTRVEAEALPVIRPILTLPDLVTFANSEFNELHALRHRVHSTLITNVALGRLDEARAKCGYLRKRAIVESQRDRRPHMAVIRVALELVPLVEADDREGMARLLWQWEAGMIKTYKLEKYWVKEPFPLEEQNGLTVWKQT